MDKEIFRIIDANLNRSREGLRVCEDITRFIMKSPALTGRLRSVRHEISGIARARIPEKNMFVDARNTREDIGRRSNLRGGMARLDMADLFSANIERVKESLRVLEEFFKLVDDKASAKFVSLRFRVYDIEKKAIKRL